MGDRLGSSGGNKGCRRGLIIGVNGIWHKCLGERINIKWGVGGTGVTVRFLPCMTKSG